METDGEKDDAMLMALADGELPAAEARHLLARLTAEPGLADRFAAFVETRDLVRRAMDPGPVPARLVAAIEAAPPPQVLRLPARPRWPAAALALAAALVMAVGLGAVITGRGAPPGGGDPALAAAAALAGLPTGAEAALPGGITARALASFDTAAGFCRLVAVGGPALAERAVVCRGDGGGWTVALAVAEGGDGFLPASDTAVALVDAYLDGIGAGPALEPAAEAARLD